MSLHEKNILVRKQESLSSSTEKLMNLYNQGEFLSVVENAQISINQHSYSFDLWNLLGAAAAKVGLNEQAVEAFEKCIALKPDYSAAHNNLGLALQNSGDMDSAIQSYTRAIALNSKYFTAHKNLGLCFQELGDYRKASEALKLAISVNSSDFSAYFNLGRVLHKLGLNDEAIDAYQKAVDINPNSADAYNNLGAMLKLKDKKIEAISAYKKALMIKPEFAELHLNIGVLLEDIGLFAEALKFYITAIEINPEYLDAHINISSIQCKLGNFESAIQHCEMSLKLQPNFSEAYYNMGISWSNLGDFTRAINAYKKAICIKPKYADAHLNLSYALLNMGRLEEGLDEYEWRWLTANESKNKRHFSIPLWNGECLRDKRILVWAEQGIGDTLNWSSHLPLLAAKAQYVTLECPEKVVPLLARSFPNIKVMCENRSNDLERNDFDFQLPMASLHRTLLSEISNISGQRSHLVTNTEKVNYWKTKLASLGKGPYVGVAWKSSKVTAERKENYASISDWEPIFQLGNITFVNLQYNDFMSDLSEIKRKFGTNVHNFEELDHFNDLDNVAALCEALDAVVSISCAIPQISSGVGTLTNLAAWEQSPWSNSLFYPQASVVKKFNRNTTEGWKDVFVQIAKEITNLKPKNNA